MEQSVLLPPASCTAAPQNAIKSCSFWVHLCMHPQPDGTSTAGTAGVRLLLLRAQLQ